ncbi:MAG: DUF488 domain-containing protein [Candidatus Jordarchaeaceae archaeon]
MLMHLFTVGHSTRTIEYFCDILKENNVQVLVDVRSWPSSKRYPQFNRENLQKSLEDKGIKYVWLGKELGGYRKKGLGEKSPNKAWTSEGFRNYADHTLTQEFMDGIGKLLSIAEKHTVAIMCAEKFYWSCHRRIISDYLKALGHTVTHIIDKEEVREHVLTSFAEIKDGKLTYPPTHFQTLNSTGGGE